MKVLVIGKGAREHALAWRLNQSQSVRKLYCAGGNPGIRKHAEPVAIAQDDFAALADFAQREHIDLTVVGPEDPLAAGIVDHFEQVGLRIFGPTRAAARLEASKAFAKTLMREAGVPTAPFEVFDDPEAAHRWIRTRGGPMVVKADGLALGKGVVVCDGPAEALRAVDDAMTRRRYGPAGTRVLIEDRLHGEELSFFVLSDGTTAIPLGAVQDYKAVFDDDRGPNTGGMGAYSPVPICDASLTQQVMETVIMPTLAAMRARRTPFRGVLFAGLMIADRQINVLEFNVRFGDPECAPLMMRFDGDLAEALMACAEGRLSGLSLSLSPRSAVSVVLASAGYPGEYRTGMPIGGLERIDGSEPSEAKVRWALEKTRVAIFQAGTAMRDGGLVTDGGRVAAVTSIATDLRKAVNAAYEAASMIDFEGKQMRHDIARRALESLPR
jgi:phosphoribosylamine---glycine ligase